MTRKSLSDVFARWPRRRWKATVVASAVVVAGYAAVIGHDVAPTQPRAVWMVAFALLGAGVGALGVIGLFLLLRQHARTEESDAQLRALINVRPLSGALPLDFSQWSADPVLADTLVRICLRTQPSQVVECGSGLSTLVLAACLQRLNHGRVTALEHLQLFADRTEELLAVAGCDDRARILTAPLETYDLRGRQWRWYQSAALEEIRGPIDLLVVDGPPGRLQHRSRFPAIPLLEERLDASCVVVLDDGYREDEAWIAREWGETLGSEPTFVERGRGIWIIERKEFVT